MILLLLLPAAVPLAVVDKGPYLAPMFTKTIQETYVLVNWGFPKLGYLIGVLNFSGWVCFRLLWCFTVTLDP